MHHHKRPHPFPHSAERPALQRWPLVALLALCAGGVSAHDTWFERLPSAERATLVLALGTGARYPLQEFTLTAAQLRHSGCRQGSAPPIRLVRERDTPRALILRTGRMPPGGGAGLSCWAESVPFDIELPPDKVTLYLREIQASPATLAAWKDMQARGVVWKERYTKHARIELRQADAVPGAAIAPAPLSGMGLEALLQTAEQSPQVGQTLVFQVLREGVPLAGLALELRSERSPLGIWRRSDANGRVAFAPPLAGRWLLRGTDLRLSDTTPDTWESRFVTLAFEVLPGRADTGSDTDSGALAAAVKTATP